MNHGTFATVINCIDGRVQEPVTTWVKEKFHVDYVDSITEPGADKVLSSGEENKISEFKKKVEVSVKAHGSHVVVCACHFDCAGNPVSMEEHKIEIKRVAEVVKSWNLPVQVVPLWVNQSWQVEMVQ